MDSVQYELVSGIMRFVFLALIVFILIRVIQISLSDLSIAKRQRGGKHYAKLVCCDTPDDYFYGLEFGLKLESTVVASSKCGIELADVSVSKSHAVIYMKGNRFLVYDAGSAAGTYLNGEPVKKAVEMFHGDIVHFGELGFKVVLQKEVADVQKAERNGSADPYRTI